MATSIIDPDNGAGTDYTSLVAWESGQQGSLSEDEIADCRSTGGSSDPGELTIDGWTTSSSAWIKIRVMDGYKHLGYAPVTGNRFRMRQVTTGVAFRTYESYCDFDGLVYECTASMDDRDIFEMVSTTPAGHIYFFNCIAINDSGTTNKMSRAFDLSFNSGFTNTHYVVVNCQSIGADDYGFAFGSGAGSGSGNYIVCANNTAYGVGQYGFRTYTATVYFFNNIAQDCGTGAFSASGILYGVNNVYDSGSIVGYNYYQGEVTFVDEANYDCRLSSSDTVAIGRGMDLRTHPIFDQFDWVADRASYDCVGTYRGGRYGEYAWDCGAYQVNTTTPSEDISIVDTAGGGDYTSLGAWEAGEQADITPRGTNVIAVAECKGGEDAYSSNLVFAGWDTQPSNPILIRNHSSEPPDGTVNTGRYYIHINTYDQYVDIQEAAFHMRGIQVINDTNAQSANDQWCINWSVSTSLTESIDLHLVNNIFYVDETSNGTQAVKLDINEHGNHKVYVVGNMMFTQEDALFLNTDADDYGDWTEFFVINNTMVGDDKGYRIDGAAVINNYFQEYTRNNIIYCNTADETFYPQETTGNYWTDDDNYNDYNLDNDATAHVARGSHGGQGTPTFLYSTGSTIDWDLRLDSSDTVAKENGENIFDTTSAIPSYAMDYLEDYLERDICNRKRPPSGNSVAWDVGAHQVTPFSTGYHLMV